MLVLFRRIAIFLSFILLLTIPQLLGTYAAIGGNVWDSPLITLNITRNERVVSIKNIQRRLFASDGLSTGEPLTGVESEITASYKRRLMGIAQRGSTAPLFEGLGTHYSFIWVGTPPQRVSVIMDTGSHHTAFPCVGCKCGKHMDPSFDPKKSATASIRTCGAPNKKCFFRQSYTEGSSWHAFKVKDRVWLGGPGSDDIAGASTRNIDFEFGCLDSETGLFRTQKVDGIMGLSAAADTLPYRLVNQKATNTRMFGLCFRHGGGVVTIGGIDESLHLGAVRSTSKNDKNKGLRGTGSILKQSVDVRMNRTSDGNLYFAKMLKPAGWYTVRLMDVLMRPSGEINSPGVSIGGPSARFNSGKGTIVDSGTTDTYLPSALKSHFVNAFKSFTGRQYSNTQMSLTQEQFSKLPVIMFRLQSADLGGGSFDLEVYPSSYMEKHKSGKYTPRIYLTEGSGTVLGANTINEHNVIFDPDQLRVGFAKSTCTFDKTITKHDFHSSTDGPATIPLKVPTPKQRPLNATDTMKKPFLPKKKARAKSGPRGYSLKPSTSTRNGSKPNFFSSISSYSAAAVGLGAAVSGYSDSILSVEQRQHLVETIRDSADELLQGLHDSCAPSLAVSCSASCSDISVDKLRSALSSWPTANKPSSEVSLREIIAPEMDTNVNSIRIVKKLAYKMTGKQLVKVPRCSAESKNEDTKSVSGSYDMKSSTCEVYCAVPADLTDVSAESITPVRVDMENDIDESWTVCQTHESADHSYFRHRLAISSKSFTGSGNILILKPSDNCYEVPVELKNVTSGVVVDRNRHDCRVVHFETARCHALDHSCDPLSTNVAYGNASFLPHSQEELLVTIYLRLQSQRDSIVHDGADGINKLSRYQRDDIRSSFANIFGLDDSKLQLSGADPAKFPFSFLTSTPLQLHMKLHPTDVLPQSVQEELPSALQHLLKATTNSANADVEKSWNVLRLVVKEYISSVVTHPMFPTIFTQYTSRPPRSDASQHSNATRSQWITNTDAHFAGVTVRDQRTADNSAQFKRCTEPSAVVWADYYGVGGSLDQSSWSNVLFSEDDGVVVRISALFTDRILPLYGTPYSQWWYFMVVITLFFCICGAMHISIVLMAMFSSICPLSIMTSVPTTRTMQLERHQRLRSD